MKRYWFKAKKYGLGWYPANKEGWAILLVYIVFVTFIIVALPPRYSWVFTVLGAIVLLMICFFTGEKLRFRWGEKK